MVFKTRQVWQPQAGSVRLRGRSVSEKRPHNGRFLAAETVSANVFPRCSIFLSWLVVPGFTIARTIAHRLAGRTNRANCVHMPAAANCAAPANRHGPALVIDVWSTPQIETRVLFRNCSAVGRQQTSGNLDHRT